MSNNNPLGFLNTEEQVHLPVGGGDFSPSGFIGLVGASVLYSFMSQEDSANGSHDDLPPFAIRQKLGASDWFRYYYKTQAEAKVAMEMLGVEGYNGKDPIAQQVWNIQVDRDSVMNFADQEKLSKWPRTILSDIEITTLRSKKRHLFHFLALPLAVQAVAKLMGYKYEPFSVSELLQRDVAFTDDFQTKMVGSPDAKQGDEGHYTNSVLYQRRAALWASLGEDNPEAYLPMGAEKFGTTSQQLSNCLQIVSSPWKNKIYGRVVQIPDPRADATYESNGETKHQTTGMLYEIFGGGEKEASEVAREELARIAKNQEAKAAANGNNNGKASDLVLPAKWAENGATLDDWEAQVIEILNKHHEKPAKPVLNKLARENDVTPAELEKIWG